VIYFPAGPMTRRVGLRSACYRRGESSAQRREHSVPSSVARVVGTRQNDAGHDTQLLEREPGA